MPNLTLKRGEIFQPVKKSKIGLNPQSKSPSPAVLNPSGLPPKINSGLLLEGSIL